MSDISALLLLLLTPATPLVVAVAVLACPRSEVLKVLGAWSALPGLITSVLMEPGIAATVPWLLEGSEFGLDRTGRAFLFFSAALWLAGGMAALSWVTRRRERFFATFLLVMSGSLGLIIARDLLAFYLFFAVMSFGSYGLIVHARSQMSRHAGRIYMSLVLAGDMMIFAALVLVAHDTAGEMLFETARGVLPGARHQHVTVALLVLGFGVKIGVLGVHVTLPLIYSAAPTPAGLVLAGAMVNAGLLGWLRLLPVEVGNMAAWGRGLAVAGVAAVFYGALVGLAQRRPRAVLAYSSISQMGVLTMAVGVAVMSSDTAGRMLAAVTVYAMHHAFAKGALFLGTGCAERSGGRHPLLVGVGLLLPVLALAGAPFTTGMLAKAWLKEGLSVAPSGWESALKMLLPWMALATSLVLARFLWLVRCGRRAHESARTGATIAWVGLLVLSLSAVWLVPREKVLDLWKLQGLWEASWPVLLGAGLAAVVPAASARLPRLRIPAGDVVVPLTRLLAAALRAWRRVSGQWLPALPRRTERAAAAVAGWPGWTRGTAAAERWLVDWRTSVTLFLLAVLLAWLLLAA